VRGHGLEDQFRKHFRLRHWRIVVALANELADAFFVL
jgi:hypothetical protein